jgi:hypothetical protein
MFERLKASPPSHAAVAAPGWSDRRRQDVPPARDVLATLPKGPALGGNAIAKPARDDARRRA